MLFLFYFTVCTICFLPTRTNRYIRRSTIKFFYKLPRYICLLIALPCLANEPSPPEIQLANVYRSGLNVQDYWVSEKLDGVRAYWDGKKLISKQGYTYQAPQWFTEALPNFPLDGELWLARNAFDELSGIVRRQTPNDADWSRVSYQIFDLPKATGTFDERLGFLQDYFQNNKPPSWLQLIPQAKVLDHQSLMQRLDALVKLGAEGLMLHLGASHYHSQRNDDLLKLKRHFDAEARVLAHLPGKGKFQGQLGSLLVEATNGQQALRRFKIGTGFSEALRASPPPLGAIITYKYFGLTNTGLPRFASYLRLRRDN